MSTPQPVLPENVKAKLTEGYHRVQHGSAALLWWDRLTDEERERLGGNLDAAFQRDRGTVRMWMRLHNRPSQPRAIIELARDLNLMSETDYRWLDREISKVDPVLPTEEDLEEKVERARTAHQLVLVQGGGGRRVYWRGERVMPACVRPSVTWELLWGLAEAAKNGAPLSWDELSNSKSERTIVGRRSRLKKYLPAELDALIEPGDDIGSYALEIPAEQICLIDLRPGEWLM